MQNSSTWRGLNSFLAIAIAITGLVVGTWVMHEDQRLQQQEARRG
jgi:hypothetical protein